MKNTILNDIIQYKQKELEAQKAVLPLSILLKRQRKREHFSLKKELLKENASGIIAEFKRRSPSLGWINKDADPARIIPEYEKCGASAVSILTDSHFFGGSLADIIGITEIISIPVLRKDFIIDEYQIIEAGVAGADVILLIAANLTPKMVKQLAKTAKQFHLEVLMEVHDRKELDHLSEDIDLVGVNNRDLHTFKTDLQVSIDLSKKIPGQFVKISESGIHRPDDIRRLREHGFKGFLMGERFMKTYDPGKACSDFIAVLNQ